jgi:putative two-component system response regulator
MPNPSEAGPKNTVLVVDDSPDGLQILNQVLKRQYEVRLARSGVQALEGAQQKPRPDAILLDISMPGMDGYEVCSRLKANDATRDIPVIFITAKTDVEDAQRGFDLGGADYITKPILPPVVLARVSTHIALKLAREFMRGKTWI